MSYDGYCVLCFNQFVVHKGSTSGPAKIRRAIERLRTDVVKGLGVKLLDRVLEIMEEEDDDIKREVIFFRFKKVKKVIQNNAVPML